MGRQAKERARRHRLNLRVRANEIVDGTGTGYTWDTAAVLSRLRQEAAECDTCNEPPTTKGTDHGESNRERITPGPRT